MPADPTPAAMRAARQLPLRDTVMEYAASIIDRETRS